MAIIPQKILFGWSDIEELGDLERLVSVLESMPHEKLVSALEKIVLETEMIILFVQCYLSN